MASLMNFAILVAGLHLPFQKCILSILFITKKVGWREPPEIVLILSRCADARRAVHREHERFRRVGGLQVVAYRVRQQIGRDGLPVEVAVQMRAKASARHALARGAERAVHAARRARPHEQRVKRRGGRHGHRAGNAHTPPARRCGWLSLWMATAFVVAFGRL